MKWKYVSLSLVAVLLAMWVAGLFGKPALRIYLYQRPTGGGQGILWFGSGNIGFTHLGYCYDDVPFVWLPRQGPLRLGDFTGYFNLQWRSVGKVCAVPISCVITALLPLVVGAFTRFKFSIRMWLAWSAIIAVQCAYFASRVYFVAA